MNMKNLMWILMFIVVFFIVIDLVPLFMGRPYYFESSKLKFDFSTQYATLTSSVKIYVKDEKRIKDLIDSCNSKTNFDEESEKNLRSIFGESLSLKSYSCQAKKLSANEIYLTETYLISGLVENEKDSLYRVSFGKTIDKVPVNTEIIYVFPDNAKILEVSPQPLKDHGGILTWEFKSGEKMEFPRVRFMLRKEE